MSVLSLKLIRVAAERMIDSGLPVGKAREKPRVKRSATLGEHSATVLRPVGPHRNYGSRMDRVHAHAQPAAVCRIAARGVQSDLK